MYQCLLLVVVFSFHETDIVGGFPVRPHVTDIMPQLDGPASVHARRPA